MSGSSLFNMSPEEHIAAETARREFQLASGGFYPPLDPINNYPPAPPGYIQVWFYKTLQRACREMDPDLVANVPLDRGGLHLGRVKAMWGLDSVILIDPMRWEEFHPGQEDWIAPLTVHILSESQNHIKCFQPPQPVATTLTTSKHLTRHIFLTSSTLLNLSYTSILTHSTPRSFFSSLSILRTLTRPLHRLSQTPKTLSEKLSSWQSTYESRILQTHPDKAWFLCPSEYGGLVWMFLYILLLVWIGLSVTGCFSLNLGERFQNWARTGEFGVGVDGLM